MVWYHTIMCMYMYIFNISYVCVYIYICIEVRGWPNRIFHTCVRRDGGWSQPDNYSAAAVAEPGRPKHCFLVMESFVVWRIAYECESAGILHGLSLRFFFTFIKSHFFMKNKIWKCSLGAASTGPGGSGSSGPRAQRCH